MNLPLTMPTAGLIFLILMIVLALVDLFFVLFRGTGSSISAFLITVGFKTPVTVFTFGLLAGHLFAYMRVPADNPICHWEHNVAAGMLIAFFPSYLIGWFVGWRHK